MNNIDKSKPALILVVELISNIKPLTFVAAVVVVVHAVVDVKSSRYATRPSLDIKPGVGGCPGLLVVR